MDKFGSSQGFDSPEDSGVDVVKQVNSIQQLDDVSLADVADAENGFENSVAGVEDALKGGDYSAAYDITDSLVGFDKLTAIQSIARSLESVDELTDMIDHMPAEIEGLNVRTEVIGNVVRGLFPRGYAQKVGDIIYLSMDDIEKSLQDAHYAYEVAELIADDSERDNTQSDIRTQISIMEEEKLEYESSQIDMKDRFNKAQGL